MEAKTIYNVGWAVEKMRQGYRVTRLCWDATDRFIYLVDGSTFTVNRPPLNTTFENGTAMRYQPHVDCYDNGVCGTWSITMEDLLATDWVVAAS